MNREPGWIFESSISGPQTYDYDHSGAVTPARTPFAQRSATWTTQVAFPTPIVMPTPPKTPQFPVPHSYHPSPVGPSPQHQSSGVANVQHHHLDYSAWRGVTQSISNPVDNQPSPPPLAPRPPLHLSTSNESVPSPPPVPPRPHLHIYTSNESFPLPPHHYTSHPPEAIRPHQRQNQGPGGDGSNKPDTGTVIASDQRESALWGMPGKGQPREVRGLGLIDEQGLLGDRAPGSSVVQGDEFTGLTIAQLMERRKPEYLGDRVLIHHQTPIHGGCGAVYVGSFEGQTVAVKIMLARPIPEDEKVNEDQASERRVGREIKVWAALRHPNICEFLGYTNTFSEYLAMVSRWCDGHTAIEYLRSQTLAVKDRVRLAHDVSKGLHYMHNLEVIHGDIKTVGLPKEYFIRSKLSVSRPTFSWTDSVAKLCDFGLVRLHDWQGPAEMMTTAPYTGTTLYKAPELFVGPNNRCPVATFEGDIYSFGCIMLEFIERLCPFERLRTSSGGQAAIECKGPPAERSEANGALGPDMTEPLWDLLETCWKESPTKRPKICHIVEKLDFFAQTTLT